jgi:hypothetical protein
MNSSKVSTRRFPLKLTAPGGGAEPTNFGGIESLGPPLGAICCPQLDKKTIMKINGTKMITGQY